MVEESDHLQPLFNEFDWAESLRISPLRVRTLGNDDRSAIPAHLPSLKLSPIANSLPDLDLSKVRNFAACLLA